MLARTFRILVLHATATILCVSAWARQLPATACSTAGLSGTYGAILYGSTSNGDVLAYGGQLTFNGKGTVHGNWTTNLNNAITTASVTGNYTVPSNCFGSISITPQGSSAIDFNFAAGSSQRLELIVTNPGISVIGYALPQGAATCTAAGLAGTWAWNSNGLTAGFISLVSLSANRTLHGTSTIVVNGEVQKRLTTGGTFTINSNCSGTVTFTLNGQQQGTADIVVVSGGNEVLVTNALGFITASR